MEEKALIRDTKPTVGHSNYVIYYYWWRSTEGNNLYTVEATSPTEVFKPYSAYRNKK